MEKLGKWEAYAIIVSIEGIIIPKDFVIIIYLVSLPACYVVYLHLKLIHHFKKVLYLFFYRSLIGTT